MWFKKKQDQQVDYKVVEAIERYIKTDTSTTPYMYIFVRDDLSEAQKIIQAGHAIERLKEQFNRPFGETPHFALMGVNNETDLKEVGSFLTQVNVDHKIFFEPDVGEFTAIATVPLVGKARFVMNGFKLFRGRA